MKYKVTLNGKTYEVEVEAGEAIPSMNMKRMLPRLSPQHLRLSWFPRHLPPRPLLLHRRHPHRPLLSPRAQARPSPPRCPAIF